MIEEKINKRIVLAGGPSTGKTSVIDALRKSQFHCFQEAEREILTDYKLHGSEFKTNPIDISNEILKKRHEDYEKGENISCKENLIFYDRGIHEITAYLKSINKSTNYWNKLPENAKYYIKQLEDFINAKISSISTSPERKDTILIENPFG